MNSKKPESSNRWIKKLKARLVSWETLYQFGALKVALIFLSVGKGDNEKFLLKCEAKITGIYDCFGREESFLLTEDDELFSTLRALGHQPEGESYRRDFRDLVGKEFWVVLKAAFQNPDYSEKLGNEPYIGKVHLLDVPANIDEPTDSLAVSDVYPSNLNTQNQKQ